MKHSIVTNIPKTPKRIYDYALSKSFQLLIDEKDSLKNPGFQRVKSNLSYEEAFELIQKNKPHWVISYRNVSFVSKNEKDFWEFAGCNIATNDYGSVFIWINVDLEEAEKIFEKFNLKREVY